MPMFSFQQDLTQYLLSRGLIDEILPTTPDMRPLQNLHL